MQGEYPASQILDEAGQLIGRRARLSEGQKLTVAAALCPGEAPRLAGLCATPQQLHLQMSRGMPASVRRLARAQQHCPGLQVVDPLQAMHALEAGEVKWLPSLSATNCLAWQVVSAICVEGQLGPAALDLLRGSCHCLGQ